MRLLLPRHSLLRALELEEILLSCLGILLELLSLRGREEDSGDLLGMGGREEDSGDR